MARVAGVDIPDNKRIEIALRRIHGIGPTLARKIAAQADLSGNPKVRDVPDDRMARVREIVDHDYTVEGDLKREVNDNVRRLIDIGTYRGLRHRRGLPCTASAPAPTPAPSAAGAAPSPASAA